MPAYLLSGAAPKRIDTPNSGQLDKLGVRGKVDLARDGSAAVNVTLSFHGKYATQLRSALAQVPENQLHDILESRVLGAALRGARLSKYQVARADQLDTPLEIQMQGQVPRFAQSTGGMLLISPPFSPRIGGLATLPTRQTPLLIGDATYHEVELSIRLPKGAQVVSQLQSEHLEEKTREVKVNDHAKAGHLVLNRSVRLEAGRIQPSAYGKFQNFARRADEALSAGIRIKP
jgi:hypothetical protein